jgi:hypothetical protein
MVVEVGKVIGWVGDKVVVALGPLQIVPLDTHENR